MSYSCHYKQCVFWIISLCSSLTLIYSQNLFTNDVSNIKHHITQSIRKDLIGDQCKFEFVESFDDLLSYNGNKAAISYYLPNTHELVDYYKLISVSLTRSNPAFGKGYVIGEPAAELWAQNTVVGWAIPPEHPRNAIKQFCVNHSQESGIHPVISYPNLTDALVPFYTVKLQNAFIDDNGVAALPCGYYQGHQACETIFKFIGKKWYRNLCKKSTSQSIPDCQPSESKLSDAQDIDTVFVITAQWDHNYHHYLLDSLMRIIRHIDFLRDNPHIKIQIRKYEKFVDTDKIFRRKEEREAKRDSFLQTAREIRRRINELLGLDDGRFIFGPIRAKVAYFPRSIRCSSPISHALEVRLLSSQLLSRAQSIDASSIIAPSKASSGNKKKLILQYRHCATEKECKKSWRGWTDQQFKTVYDALHSTYINHEIVVIGYQDGNMSSCLPCQIQQYASADVIFGLHGAGMTNVMFMKPGSLIIEIIGKFDGRMLPVCGYHGPLAAMYGCHHYLHYYDWKGDEVLSAHQAASESYQFYQYLQQHRIHVH